MEEGRKEGFIAGGILLLVGILVSVIGYDQGWNAGKLTIIIGVFMVLIGGGSIWKPESVGQVLAHYLNKQAGGQGGGTSQSQTNTKNSTQANAGRDATVNNYYNRGDLPEEKESDEKKELIKEINQDLTKDRLSNVLIRCIRLAALTDSKKEKVWLEKEAEGLERVE